MAKETIAQQIRYEKGQLESRIAAVILDFEKETGLVVSSVELTRIEQISSIGHSPDVNNLTNVKANIKEL